MERRFFETKGPGIQEPDESIDEYSYARYRELGGIINEKDYTSALSRAEAAPRPRRALILQAESIAKNADFELHNSKGVVDPIIILYGILRNDTKPINIEHHHVQMSDQCLFAEVLRMLGEDVSLKKLIEAYPQITF